MKRTNIQNIAIGIFIAILIGVAWYLMYQKNNSSTVTTYTSEAHGITFDYSNKYNLTETIEPSDTSTTILTLTNKGIRIPKNGEGPTAITILISDIGSVASTKQKGLDTWVTTSPYSNFTLSASTSTGVTTISGKDARLYTWDGLYKGTTIATLVNSKIYMFSVTYESETDLKKREDFTDLVASVKFLDSK